MSGNHNKQELSIQIMFGVLYRIHMVRLPANEFAAKTARGSGSRKGLRGWREGSKRKTINFEYNLIKQFSQYKRKL